jgi:hypothetical protein
MGLPMMEMKICIHNPFRIAFYYYPYGGKTFLDECTKALSHPASCSRSRNHLGCSHTIKCNRIALYRVNSLFEAYRPGFAQVILPIKIDFVHNEV